MKLQEDLRSVAIWCDVNGMRLNVAKCSFMDVTLSKFRRFGRYMIGNTLIPYTNNIKLLGLNIAHNHSWNNHTETVRAKSAKLIGFVSRNLRGCSPKVEQQAFITLIRPIMSFGAPTWHPTTHGNIYKLQML
jgi:hypothetical protein